MLKKTITIYLGSLLLFSGLAYLNAAPALACSCALPGSPSQEFKGAAAVFSGRVSEKSLDSRGQYYLIDFDGERSWKGIASGPARVRTEKDGAVCGYDFKVGESYLVYAGKSESGELSTSICSRTKLLAQASDDLRDLGQGKPFVRQGPVDGIPPPEKSDSITLIVIAAVLAIGFIIGVWSLIKRK